MRCEMPHDSYLKGDALRLEIDMLHTALPSDVRWSSLRTDKRSLGSDDDSVS